jgi:hypothetical protein
MQLGCTREHPDQHDEAWFKREIAPKLDAMLRRCNAHEAQWKRPDAGRGCGGAVAGLRLRAERNRLCGAETPTLNRSQRFFRTRRVERG